MTDFSSKTQGCIEWSWLGLVPDYSTGGWGQVNFQIAPSRRCSRSRSSLLWMRMEKKTMEFSLVRKEKRSESMAGLKDSNISEGGLVGQCSCSQADVHIMLSGVTWLKPCGTRGNHFYSVCPAQLRVQLGRKDMAQFERSAGMPRGLENLTQKAHVP